MTALPAFGVIRFREYGVGHFEQVGRVPFICLKQQDLPVNRGADMVQTAVGKHDQFHRMHQSCRFPDARVLQECVANPFGPFLADFVHP